MSTVGPWVGLIAGFDHELPQRSPLLCFSVASDGLAIFNASANGSVTKSRDIIAVSMAARTILWRASFGSFSHGFVSGNASGCNLPFESLGG
jgi:hypothetical protein